MDIISILFSVILFVIGIIIIVAVLMSATRTFVLPRSAPDKITRWVFVSARTLFDIRMRKVSSYEDRDRIMALFAPVSLLSLPAAWLFGMSLGYMCIYRALGVPGWRESFTMSGSLLLTLGLNAEVNIVLNVIGFTEAAVGLILVALLIAYLPTMYSAFSKRETSVTMLEVRAGSPPSAVTMMERFHRLNRMSILNEEWSKWEVWFVELEETHTSLAALAFFRSPKAHRSWITAAGTVLDAAAIYLSVLDVESDPQAALCLRAGYLALRYIADFFRIEYDPDPKPTDPISITQAEFDAAYDELAQAGIAVKADREQAWKDFSGWRINYDTVLLSLAAMLMAPYAPWISDRSLRRQGSSRFRRNRQLSQSAVS